MKKRLLVIANIGFIIGIILGLYFNIGIILFLLVGTGHFCNFLCKLHSLVRAEKICILLNKLNLLVRAEKICNFLNKLNLFNKELQKCPVPTNEKLQKCPVPTNKKISKYLKLYITKKVLITFIIFCILGFMAIFLQSNKFEDFWKDMTIIQNNNTTVNAIVVSDKESKEYNDIYKVKIVRINNKKYYNTYCIVKLNKSTDENLTYGSLIQFKGEFQEPQDRTNFKGYSYKEYLKTVNVYGTFKTKYNKVQVLKEKSYDVIHILSNKVKNSFKCQLDKLYTKNPEEKSLIKGILLGEKTELTEEQIDNFKISNLSHILAVSGMHIAYIILGIMFILKLLGISKQKIHIITILLIIFFMFLTEFTPSVVRASIMAILVLVSFLVKRKADVWINISISSLLILICNPYALSSLSYQLSYLGTIGIILGVKVVNTYRENKLKEKLKSIKQFIIDTVIVCLSAQLFVFPIILLNFNTFAIYFLISNLLIAPIIGILVVLGFVVIIIAHIFYPLAYYLNLVETILLKFINIMTDYIAKMPNSIIYFKTPYITSLIIYFAIILIFVGIYTSKQQAVKRKIKKYKKQLLKIFKIFLIVYIIIILLVDLNVLERPNIKIYFVDVGQGDCTLVVTEKNKKILIDGGGSTDKNYDIGKNTTLPYLLDRRVSKLDYMMISHFDADHAQACIKILESITVKNIILAKQLKESDLYSQIVSIAKSKKINLIYVGAGNVLNIDKVKLTILHPQKDLITENPMNNNSIVCKLQYNSFSILFTGDIEEIAEKLILSKNINLKADIIKIAHHRF